MTIRSLVTGMEVRKLWKYDGTTKPARDYLGYTQVKFAEFLEVDIRKIQNWDTRKTYPEYVDRLVNIIVACMEDYIEDVSN